MLDNDAKHGGVADDITKDKVYDDLLRRCRIGEFLAVLAAPPCSTFSVSRFFAASDSDDGGPLPVRDADHIYGLPDVHASHAPELARANLVTRRTIALLTAAYDAGAQFILENPADRSDRDVHHLFLTEKHGSIWRLPEVVALEAYAHAHTATFAQCQFGGKYQKYTSLLHSAGFDTAFEHLNSLKCTHSDHTAASSVVDVTPEGTGSQPSRPPIQQT